MFFQKFPMFLCIFFGDYISFDICFFDKLHKLLCLFFLHKKICFINT